MYFLWLFRAAYVLANVLFQQFMKLALEQHYHGMKHPVYLIPTNKIVVILYMYQSRSNAWIISDICLSMFQGLFRIAGSASRLKKLKVCSGS